MGKHRPAAVKDPAALGPGSKALRRRGRPRVSGDALAARRAGVLAAAGPLLAERHSRDITVELLIQAAGTSRPTFYRWFPGGIEQVIEMLIAEANEDLVARIVAVVAAGGGLDARVSAGIRAYFDWCVERGPVVYGIYREGFDERSPAWRYRQQTIENMVAVLGQQAQALGFVEVTRLMIETLVSWIETAAVVLFRHYPFSREEADEQCRRTMQMSLAMLEMVRGEQGT